MAVVPSYISRSAAGSYDNEAVAIFALVFSFYTYLKAANTVNPLKIYLPESVRDHCCGHASQHSRSFTWLLPGVVTPLSLTSFQSSL